MKSFKSLLIFQFSVLILGMILFLLFSTFFTYKLASDYEKKHVEEISSILAENINLIAEIYPNKYLIEESMKKAVDEIPALEGICFSLNKKIYCYPSNLKKEFRCTGTERFTQTGNKIFISFPIYEEYASQFLERKEEGCFLAVFNSYYVDQFRNYWFLNALLISLSFIILGAVVIISIWLDIKFDFDKLKGFIDKLKKPDSVLVKPDKNDVYSFKIREFRDVATLISELTEQISRLNDYIKQLAVKDPLTGLFNRNYFNLVIKGSFLPLWKRKAFPTSVALLDIDNFKSINDIYGHAKGDEVLRRFGSIVKETLRGSDIPIRYGGEEVLIIFPSSKKEEAVKAVERIRSKLIKEDFGIGRPVTFSSGLSDFPSDVKVPGDIDRLIELADERLYRAKREGKNRDVLF